MRDLGLKFKPIPDKGFKWAAIAMQTSWVTGTRNLPLSTPVLPSHEAVGLFSMPDVLYVGPPSFNLKLHFLQLKPNTLLCPCPYVTSYLL